MSQQINLYNPALRKPREWLTAGGLVSAVGLALLVVLMASAVTRFSLSRAAAEAEEAEQALRAEQNQLNAVNAQLAALRHDAALQRQIDIAQAQLKGREEILAALGEIAIEPGKGFANYLRGLARQSINGLWLTGVTIGPANELSIRGRTTSQSLVADYVRQLAADPVFNGHRFAQMTMGQTEQPKPDGEAIKTSTAGLPRPLEFNLLTVPATDTASATGKHS